MRVVRLRPLLVRLAAALCLLGVGSAPRLADAQGLTGQIIGTVVDDTGGALPGATVKVKNTATQAQQDVTTDATGAFVVPNLLPGTYDITVSLEGFRTYEQKGVVLSATQRVGLKAITLSLGQMSDAVTVTAGVESVQLQSGERSANVTSDQILGMANRGRNFISSLRGLPGFVDTNLARDTTGWEALNGTSINGQTSYNVSYDGVTNKDTGQNNANYAAPSLESIGGDTGAVVELLRRDTAARRVRPSSSSPRAAARTSMAALRSTSATRP